MSRANAYKGGRRDIMRAHNRFLRDRLYAFDEALEVAYRTAKLLVGVGRG